VLALAGIGAWALVRHLERRDARAELLARLERDGPMHAALWWRQRVELFEGDASLAMLFREPEPGTHRGGGGDERPVDLLSPMGPIAFPADVRLTWLDARPDAPEPDLEFVVERPSTPEPPLIRQRVVGTKAADLVVATPAPAGVRLLAAEVFGLADVLRSAPIAERLHASLRDVATGERLDEAFFERAEVGDESTPRALPGKDSMLESLRAALDRTDRALSGRGSYVEAVVSWAPVRTQFPSDRIALLWLEALHEHFTVESLRAAAREALDRAPAPTDPPR
jgi:hypothetical protein